MRDVAARAAALAGPALILLAGVAALVLVLVAEAADGAVTVPKGGAPVEATFVARQTGRFPIECSECCGSGHTWMKGELAVTARAQ